MGRTVILGGGVAGLTVAHRLARSGREVLCLEAQAAAGGVVQTRRVDGYLCEVGPQNFLEAAGGPVSRLASELGLDGELVASTDARAYLHHAGATRSLPRDLPALLSWRGLGRGLLEAFVPRGPAGADATVLAWGTRRFGKDVAELLLDPAAWA
jgi:oxygen-dependent protoporphyrinogen oxidase